MEFGSILNIDKVLRAFELTLSMLLVGMPGFLFDGQVVGTEIMFYVFGDCSCQSGFNFVLTNVIY